MSHLDFGNRSHLGLHHWGSTDRGQDLVLFRIRRAARIIIAILFSGFSAPALAQQTSRGTVSGNRPTTIPICLHPDNPRWFLWREKATALITSAEHNGAVLNPDFESVGRANGVNARCLSEPTLGA